MRRLPPILCAVLALLLMASTALAQNFQYRRTLTATSNSTNAVADQQVLVELNPGNFDYSHVNAGGSDIRFSTDPTGATTGLNYFIENFDATGISRIWVRVPNVPPNGSTDFYMFYGDPALNASTSDFNATFPNAFISNGNSMLSGMQNFDWFEIRAGDTVTVGAGTLFELQARVIRIAGTLDGTGAGHPAGTIGPNPGAGPGGGQADDFSGAGGGGYGGQGGEGGFDTNDPPNSGGMTYGTATTTDIDMGSGGGSSDTNSGGTGGAGISLVGIFIDITGTILANGADADQPGGARGGGGGSGGGILVLGYEVHVSGEFRANGGDGSVGTSTANDDGGGGGGGRIKVFGENSLDNTATFAVDGGMGGPNGTASGADNGALGTIHAGAAPVPDRAILTNLGVERTVGVANIIVTVDGNQIQVGDRVPVALGATLDSLNLQIEVTAAVDVNTTISNLTTQGILESEFSMMGATGPYTLTPTTGVFNQETTHLVTIDPQTVPAMPFTFELVVGKGIAISRGMNEIANGGTDDVGALANGIGHVFEYTITAAGGDPLNLMGTPPVEITASAGAQVLVLDQPANTQLNSGNSETFRVYVFPTAANFSATLSISNDSPTTPFTFMMTGTGQPVPAIAVAGPLDRPVHNYGLLDVGRLDLNAVGTRTFTITNAGDADLTLSADPVTVSDEQGAMVTVVQPTNLVIGAGNSQTFDLQISPTAGSFSFTVEIASNDPDDNPFRFAVSGVAIAGGAAEVQLSVDGHGDVANNATVNVGKMNLAGRQIALSIANLGSADLTLLNAQLLNQTNCTATVTMAPASPLMPGTSTPMTVQIVPAAIGNFSVRLQIDTNDANENPAVLMLVGEAIAGAEPFISVWRLGSGTIPPNTTDTLGNQTLGHVPAGENVRLTYVIENLGTGNLNVGLPVRIDNAMNCTAEIIVQPMNPLVIPLGDVRIVVQLSPAAAGEFSARVRIESDDPLRSPYEFTVRGNLMPAPQPPPSGGGGNVSGGGGCGILADSPTGTAILNWLLLMLALGLIGLRRRTRL